MKQKIFTKMAVSIAVIFLLSACGINLVGAAPDIILKDIEGNTVQLSQYKGKVIILDFFATTCPPCREEIPDFIELQNEYGDKGFVMIGVSLSGLSDVRLFAEMMGINYPVLLADRDAVKAYGPIRSIPLTYVIDKEFNIVKKYIGYRPKEEFETQVKELLAKQTKQ